MHLGMFLSLENIGNTSIKHTIKINKYYLLLDSSSHWMKSHGKGEIKQAYLSNAQGSGLLNLLLKSCLYRRTTKKGFPFHFRSSIQEKMVSMMVLIANVFVWKTTSRERCLVAWHFANHIFATLLNCIFLWL